MDPKATGAIPPPVGLSSPVSMFAKFDPSPPFSGSESYSEEELFHLEMSDEGGSCGKKRSKMDETYQMKMASLPAYNVAFAIQQPQKRVAGQEPLGASASDSFTSKKKARRLEAMDAKQKWICQQRASLGPEENDSDPFMAKAAVYFLLVLEDQLVAKNFYDCKNRIHTKSVSICVDHRRKLLDWLYRVNLQFGFHFDTWVLTASLLDRFLSAQPIEKDVFQLVGCAAFLIAAKHEERYPPKISELVDICARCYQKIDFLKMEQIMLIVLEWKILTPTINIMVREISLVQHSKAYHPQFLANMVRKIVCHKNLAYMPPSKVAFTMISAADPRAEPEDVDKTFKYLLYLMKLDPDKDEFDEN